MTPLPLYKGPHFIHQKPLHTLKLKGAIFFFVIL